VISWIRIRISLQDKPKCVEYEAILALFQDFEPLSGSKDPDSDPHLSDEQDPDPHHGDADPPHWS
jgi:hypothetical protein